MQEPRTTRFDTRAEFDTQFRACLAAARTRIDLFDPDFAIFTLGTSEVDASLREFLKRGGVLRLAMHSPAHIERHYPRFLRLLRDYSHLLSCRSTPKSLRNLTDSFCIADDCMSCAASTVHTCGAKPASPCRRPSSCRATASMRFGKNLFLSFSQPQQACERYKDVVTS